MHAVYPHVIRHARNRAGTDRRIIQQIACKVQPLQIPKWNTSERLRGKPKRRTIDKQADACATQQHADQASVCLSQFRPIAPADREIDAPNEKRRTGDEPDKLNDQPTGRQQRRSIDRLLSHVWIQFRLVLRLAPLSNETALAGLLETLEAHLAIRFFSPLQSNEGHS